MVLLRTLILSVFVVLAACGERFSVLSQERASRPSAAVPTITAPLRCWTICKAVRGSILWFLDRTQPGAHCAAALQSWRVHMSSVERRRSVDFSPMMCTSPPTSHESAGDFLRYARRWFPVSLRIPVATTSLCSSFRITFSPTSCADDPRVDSPRAPVSATRRLVMAMLAMAPVRVHVGMENRRIIQALAIAPAVSWSGRRQ